MTRDLKRAAALRNALAESKMPVSYLHRCVTVTIAHDSGTPRTVDFQLEAITHRSGKRSYPARRICAEGIVVAAEAFVNGGWQAVPALIGWPAEGGTA